MIEMTMVNKYSTDIQGFGCYILKINISTKVGDHKLLLYTLCIIVLIKSTSQISKEKCVSSCDCQQSEPI
jgi:hypothetical protein